MDHIGLPGEDGLMLHRLHDVDATLGLNYISSLAGLPTQRCPELLADWHRRTTTLTCHLKDIIYYIFLYDIIYVKYVK